MKFLEARKGWRSFSKQGEYGMCVGWRSFCKQGEYGMSAATRCDKQMGKQIMRDKKLGVLN
jgi:hypothetical protein